MMIQRLEMPGLPYRCREIVEPKEGKAKECTVLSLIQRRRVEGMQSQGRDFGDIGI